jgi:hypothetical protein
VETFVGKHFDSWDEVIVASRSCWVGGAYTEGLGTTGPIHDTCHKLWCVMSWSVTMLQCCIDVAVLLLPEHSMHFFERG